MVEVGLASAVPVFEPRRGRGFKHTSLGELRPPKVGCLLLRVVQADSIGRAPRRGPEGMAEGMGNCST